MMRILVIAKNTFRENVRDKVLYNLILFALIMILCSLVIGELSLGNEVKIILDLGLAAISIFGMFIAVFLGIGLVYKELDKRTIYALLSKPVRRYEFILGKYLGLLYTLLVNVAVMTVGLELALLYAAREGAIEIVILAALGGRLDQTVANLLLLALPELDGLDVRIVDGPQTAFLIRGGRDGDDGRDVVIEGQPGDTISLIPLGGDAVGVTAEGVAWPLQEGTLRFGPARGVSNVLTAAQARVRVREGVLLCVVIRQE